MSRLARKKRTADELGLKSAGGITDLFDNLPQIIYIG